LNVTLAALLKNRGILSVPESILSLAQKGRRLPDITLADLWGVRIVIEGRSNTSAAIKRTLFDDAKQRVLDGISPICLAVLYPPEVRHVDAETDLAKVLEAASLTVRVISEGGDGDWDDTTVDGLADTLRRSYELLVSEDVVTDAVSSLEDAIEEASTKIASIRAAPARLRKVLGIAES
jgi:hypothetical protein